MAQGLPCYHQFGNVDARWNAHGLKHENQIFSDHIARGAWRVRAATQTSQGAVKNSHPHIVGGQTIGQSQSARVVHVRGACFVANFCKHTLKQTAHLCGVGHARGV